MVNILQDYLESHPADELDPYLKSDQVHHIFGKWSKDFRLDNTIRINIV